MCIICKILGKTTISDKILRMQVPLNKDRIDCNDCEWRLLANLTMIVMVMVIVMMLMMATMMTMVMVMNMMVVVDARR